MHHFLRLAFLWGPPKADRSGKCGPVHKADCDPQGFNPCCSAGGNCGIGTAHCDCDTCVDFRKKGNGVLFYSVQ